LKNFKARRVFLSKFFTNIADKTASSDIVAFHSSAVATYTHIWPQQRESLDWTHLLDVSKKRSFTGSELMNLLVEPSELKHIVLSFLFIRRNQWPGTVALAERETKLL